METTQTVFAARVYYMQTALEVLADLMTTSEDIDREWRRFSLAAGPFSGETKRRVFQTARVGSILTDPESTRAFARRIAPKVDLNIKAVLEHFTTYPWFYTIFEVEKIVGDGFLIAKIRDSHEMLFSKPAEAKAREGGGCMLGLLFFNGACFQSWGEVVLLDSFFEGDIRFFARTAACREYEEKGIESAIIASPLPFLLLREFSKLPQTLFHGEIARACSSQLTLSSDIKCLIDQCRCKRQIIENDRYLRICLGGNLVTNPPTLYLDKKDHSLTLATFTLEGYRKARFALLSSVEFPEKPQQAVSSAMQYAVFQLFKVQPYWMSFDATFLADEQDTAPLHCLERVVYYRTRNGNLPPPDIVAEESGQDQRSAEIFLHAIQTIWDEAATKKASPGQRECTNRRNCAA
ncbi:hypothetical protein [Sediminispirochaeta smaragdinae]|uniref:Uncharacterized protein n=1 Tax=Sediminispirochaeta smaragdinae (strain DSM 11293 / JCM 15392 / SEBR 4228) TaxID=573413 RepID=E1R8E8_SEDSS|nr:hypothetical protein [Sediminispirochaeta smaragdinae]ADK79292.1 hypothetical protein Spirs_0135 [Sediminispirochaeta smaragdinae DSM 11293]